MASDGLIPEKVRAYFRELMTGAIGTVVAIVVLMSIGPKHQLNARDRRKSFNSRGGKLCRPASVTAFIAASERPELLSAKSFPVNGGGACSLVIPSWGVAYRGQSAGSMVEREFDALFVLLELFELNLSSLGLKELLVMSSNPTFVLSFVGDSPHMADRSGLKEKLAKLTSTFKFQLAFIRQQQNKALHPITSLPSPSGMPRLKMPPVLAEFNNARIEQ